MDNEKVFQMNFGKVYELLLNKATRKGRTKSDEMTGRIWDIPTWLVPLVSARFYPWPYLWQARRSVCPDNGSPA